METFPARTTSYDPYRTDNTFAPAPSETVGQYTSRRPDSLEDTLSHERHGIVWTPDGKIDISLNTGDIAVSTVQMHAITTTDRTTSRDGHIARHRREASPRRLRTTYALAGLAIAATLAAGSTMLYSVNKSKAAAESSTLMPDLLDSAHAESHQTPQQREDTKLTPKPPTRADKIRSMQQKIARYAWPKYRPRGTSGARTMRAGYAKDVKDAGYIGGANGVDCGAFVTTVMRESGADKHYNDRDENTYGQLKYLERHDDVSVKKGETVLYHRLSAKEVKHLQPGDIAVRSHGPNTVGHTLFYVGPNQPGIDSSGKPTDFIGSYASSSLGSRAPMASPSIGNPGTFTWFRLK